MKKIRFVAIALFILLMSMAFVLPVSAAGATAHTSAAPTSKTVTNRFTGIPVSGTNANGDTFKGRLNITSFAAQGGNSIVANGTLNGTFRNAAGKVVGTITNYAVTAPVGIGQSQTGAAPAQATCTILDLVIGPIHLNLLGLVIDTNQIHLTITANPAGGLLGQLLCDIANLLNPANGGLLGNLSAIVADLNQILALLGA